MLRLLEMALEEPTKALLLALCVGVSTMHIGLYSVKIAIADIQSQQVIDAALGVTVVLMKESLIRIDENVKFIKEGQIRIFNKLD